MEDVPAVGYESWKDGAVAGVRYALRVAGHPEFSAIIHRITGLTTDTNATIVAAAAADAVWKSLKFIPAADVIQWLELMVFDSFNHSPDALPKLLDSPSGKHDLLMV